MRARRARPECDIGRRTQSLVSHATIAVQPTGRDRYGRTLAQVRVDGRDLAALLIGEGPTPVTEGARPYSGGARHAWCE